MENILVITSWSLREGIFQSAVVPYLSIIHSLNPDRKIFIFSEEKQFDASFKPDWILTKKNWFLVQSQYYRFGLKKLYKSAATFIRLIRLIRKHNIGYIHAYCTPAGTIGYILSKISGAKLVIDSFEPHAEAMVENGTWSRESMAFKILWAFEKLQAKHAAYCIGIASGMDSYALQKWGAKVKQYLVRPMCVDLTVFKPNRSVGSAIRNELAIENKIVGVYAGKFGGIYFDKEVFAFFKVASEHWGEKFVALVLSNQPQEEILAIARQSAFPENKLVVRNIQFSEMPTWLSVADFAITPVKPVPTKRYCSPIKDGEYWSMGLPIVIPDNISDDSAIVSEHNIGYVLKGQTIDEYRNALQKIDNLLSEDVDVVHRCMSVAEKYRNYSKAVECYQKIYK